MPTVLITGANRGIGFEIARQLGALGWQVILSGRNPERGTEAASVLRRDGSDVVFAAMDVGKPESIQAAFKEIGAKYTRIDVLINNAGILLSGDRQILESDEEMVRQVFQINAIGAMQVVQTFKPLLGQGSRVIMMSSGGGSMTDPVGGWSPVYCVSKTLMNGITRHLDYALRPEGILVNAMCPGWVRTEMGGKSAPRSVEKGAETAVWLSTTDLTESGYFWRDKRKIPW